MKNYITTLAEVLGAGLIIYGVYTINVSLALIIAGAFLITGSYLTIRSVYSKEKTGTQHLET